MCGQVKSANAFFCRNKYIKLVSECKSYVFLCVGMCVCILFRGSFTQKNNIKGLTKTHVVHADTEIYLHNIIYLGVCHEMPRSNIMYVHKTTLGECIHLGIKLYGTRLRSQIYL